MLFSDRLTERVASCLTFLFSFIQVEYEELPGWTEDISSIRQYKDLPAAAQAYVERIEELIGLPVQFIGVGPGREALIVKE